MSDPRRFMHRVIACLFAVATLSLPTAALACPVCGQSAPGTESAILIMSGILSGLPLLMAGGIVAWIAIRIRAAAQESSNTSTVDRHQVADAQSRLDSLQPRAEPR